MWLQSQIYAMSHDKKKQQLPHHDPQSRPMQEAFRVLAKLRAKPMVAVFVHFNSKTLGYRVTVADCDKDLWRETQGDLAKMARCAGVYRGRILSASDIADDLHAMGVPLEVVA